MTRPHAPEGRPDDGWRDRAACRDSHTRIFTDPESRNDIRRAIGTCATCSVRAPCLEIALSHDTEGDVGVWGGTTQTTRQLIRAGHLTIEQAANPSDIDNHPDPKPHRHQARDTGAHQHTIASATQPPAAPAPDERAVSVTLDPHGDYVSPDGRVIIFQVHGEPPWMLMVDQRCVARTATVAEGRRIAWASLHGDEASMGHP